MLLSFAVRSVYLESCSMYVRGGVYVVVRDAMGPFHNVHVLTSNYHETSCGSASEEKGTSVEELVKTSGLDAKLVKAIVDGNYTASPAQRQKLADALGVGVQEIAWGHSVPVQHLRGNGPYSGRST